MDNGKGQREGTAGWDSGMGQREGTAGIGYRGPDKWLSHDIMNPWHSSLSAGICPECIATLHKTLTSHISFAPAVDPRHLPLMYHLKPSHWFCHRSAGC